MDQQFHPHPEWKRLFTAVSPRVETQTEWTYRELSEMAGIDIRSPKGRQQFYRFQKEMLLTLQLCWEVVYGRGYRIIPAHETGIAVTKRVRSSGRRLKKAGMIGRNVRHDQLSREQLAAHHELLSKVAAIHQAVTETKREVRKLALAMEQPKLSVVEQIIESIRSKEKLPN